MRFIKLVILLSTVLSVPYFWHRVKVIGPHAFSQQLLLQKEVPLDDRVKLALDQPYRYWAMGSQFYVFLSQDQQYVLKIPRASKQRECLVDRIFYRVYSKPNLLKSLSIAGQMPEQTALVRVHCSQIDEPIEVCLIDNLHRTHRVNLQKTPFALQKRQTLLSKAMSQADRHEMQQILSAFLQLIDEEKMNQVSSNDRAFWLNFGYENSRVYRLDVGSYEKMDQNFSYQKVGKPVLRYLKRHHSEVANWFQDELIKREQSQ